MKALYEGAMKAGLSRHTGYCLFKRICLFTASSSSHTGYCLFKRSRLAGECLFL